MYHRFMGEAELGNPGTTRATLQRQVEYLQANHRLITTDDHVTNVCSANEMHGCPVAITVDDGYLDFYEHAYPVFRDSGISPTVFTATGLIDGSCWFWWDKLFFILENINQESAVRTIAGVTLQLNIASKPDRLATQISISDIMRFLPNEEKFAAIDQLAASFNIELPSSPPEAYRGFTWEQVHEMGQHGILFAPHTVNHPILSRVSDEDARWEIEESTRRIAEKTGRPPMVFSYPQGGPIDFTSAHCEMVAATGLVGSYVAYQDPALSRNIFRLPRYGASNNWDQFVWMMCGAEYLLLRVQRLFGRKFQIPDSYWANHKPESN